MDKLEKNCFVIFLRICGFMNLCLFSSPDKMDDGGWDGKWKRGHAPPSLPPLWCLWARHWNRNCSSGAAQWPMCQNIFKLFFIYIFIFLDALLNRKPESREREWRTDMQWRATGWNQWAAETGTEPLYSVGRGHAVPGEPPGCPAKTFSPKVLESLYWWSVHVPVLYFLYHCGIAFVRKLNSTKNFMFCVLCFVDTGLPHCLVSHRPVCCMCTP